MGKRYHYDPVAAPGLVSQELAGVLAADEVVVREPPGRTAPGTVAAEGASVRQVQVALAELTSLQRRNASFALNRLREPLIGLSMAIVSQKLAFLAWVNDG